MFSIPSAAPMLRSGAKAVSIGSISWALNAGLNSKHVKHGWNPGPMRFFKRNSFSMSKD